jgi:hypothetical protein
VAAPVSAEYDLVSQAEAEHARQYTPEGRTWAGTLACCLLHHRDMFWQGIWGYWVHSAGMRPCEAMAGEPDPELLPCRYCGARLVVDGERLRSLVPKEDRHPGWKDHPVPGCYCPERPGEECGCPRLTWHDDAWTDKCPVSPTFRHEVTALRFTGVK